jgi:hypothetical protein
LTYNIVVYPKDSATVYIRNYTDPEEYLVEQGMLKGNVLEVMLI